MIRLEGQGLEYQLVSSRLDVIGAALCVEVDAGLVERYAGEYPYALIDPLLRQAGLALVDFAGRQGPWRLGALRLGASEPGNTSR